MKKPERMVWREGNKNHKRLLRALGMDLRLDSNDNIKIKNWLKSRCKHVMAVPDEKRIKIVYDNMIGSFETWAEACYEVAIIERKKGKRI